MQSAASGARRDGAGATNLVGPGHSFGLRIEAAGVEVVFIPLARHF
jgi:hypothetical protein